MLITQLLYFVYACNTISKQHQTKVAKPLHVSTYDELKEDDSVIALRPQDNNTVSFDDRFL